MKKEQQIEEIFTEIEKEITNAIDNNYKVFNQRVSVESSLDDEFLEVILGKINTLSGIYYFIEELKKKYIETKVGE